VFPSTGSGLNDGPGDAPPGSFFAVAKKHLRQFLLRPAIDDPAAVSGAVGLKRMSNDRLPEEKPRSGVVRTASMKRPVKQDASALSQPSSAIWSIDWCKRPSLKHGRDSPKGARVWRASSSACGLSKSEQPPLAHFLEQTGGVDRTEGAIHIASRAFRA